MQFENGELYHIYNQGNNKQTIFFNRGNYQYFIKKIETYITPYADILAWCLMPNHFHLMVKVNSTEVFASSEALGRNPSGKSRTFNQSIGIMLRSYTNAINKQQNRSGSLFRKETKAKCISDEVPLSPAYFNTAFGTSLHVDVSGINYEQQCFNYIHLNPVAAGLVSNTEGWEFSSANAYSGDMTYNLVNVEVAREEGLVWT